MSTVNRIQYETVGTGPTILVLHGTPGGHDQALAMMRPLCVRGFQLLAPSRPGYLGTPLDVGRTPAEQARAFAGLLGALGERRLVVAGLSGGGPIAIELAVRYPESVRALLLLSAVSQRHKTPGSSFTRRLALSNAAASTMRLLYRSSPALAARMMFQVLSTLRGSALTTYVRSVVADPMSRKALGDLLATMVQSELRRAGLENDVEQQALWERPVVGALRCQVLLVHGRADGRVPLAHAESFVRDCPQATLVVIEQGSHLSFLGPGSTAANERMVTFLRDLP
jgi:pimeloyl-ACP methyl ester carboxylesterase